MSRQIFFPASTLLISYVEKLKEILRCIFSVAQTNVSKGLLSYGVPTKCPRTWTLFNLATFILRASIICGIRAPNMQ